MDKITLKTATYGEGSLIFMMDSEVTLLTGNFVGIL